MLEGIQPIPREERTLAGWDFFFLWAGAAIAISEVWAGGVLAPLGFWGGLGAIILGHLIGNTPLALGGVLGSDLGIPSMVSVRVAFGRGGSYLASILNLIQLLGWTAIMIIICAQSLEVITQAVWSYSSLKLWILLAGLGSTVWALVGSSWWKWMERIAVVALCILSLFMTYTVLAEYPLSQLIGARGDGSLPFGAGLDLVIAMPISWLPLAADYSRFARKSKTAFWGTWWGYFIAGCWMYFLGLSVALATGRSDPIPAMIALGFSSVAFAIVLFSTFTTTFLDIYSSAVSFLNLQPKIREKVATLIFGVGGTLLALIFPMNRYESFLLLIGAVFVPLFGVVLFDYFIYRKRKVDLEDIYQGRMINWKAVLSWAVGVLVYELFLYLFPFVGASIPSLLISGGLYLLLMSLKPDSGI